MDNHTVAALRTAVTADFRSEADPGLCPDWDTSEPNKSRKRRYRTKHGTVTEMDTAEIGKHG